MANKRIRQLTTQGTYSDAYYVAVEDASGFIEAKKMTLAVLTGTEKSAREAQDNVIEAGCGLNANGTYIAPANSWYSRNAEFTAGCTDRGGATGALTANIYNSIRLLDAKIYTLDMWEKGSGTSAVEQGIGLNTASGNYSLALNKDNTVSGNYSLAGNRNNEVSGIYSVVFGWSNINTGDRSGILSGISCNISTNDAVICGGSINVITADSAFIGGGDNNEVNADYASIVGGLENDANGEYSHIGGGGYNSADGNYSAISGGLLNEARGTHSFVGAGKYNVADNNYSGILCGEYGQSYLLDSSAFASGRIIAKTGSSQRLDVMVYNTTTNNTPTNLGIAGSATNRVIIPVDCSMFFEIKVIASETGGVSGTVGQSFTQRINGCIKNVGGTTAIEGSTNAETAIKHASFGGTVAVSADDTNDALQIQVTGEADKNISWVAYVNLVMVGYRNFDLDTL